MKSSLLDLSATGLTRRRIIAGAASLPLLTSGSRVFSATRTIRITEANHLGMYASVYAASRGGFFAKQGLEVAISSAGGLALTIPVLLSGNATVAITGAGMSVNANREGASIVNIAKIVGGVAMWLVAKPGVTIKSAADLAGKTIATLKFPSSTIQMPSYALKRAGLDIDALKVKFLQLPPGAQAQAVLDGRADVAAMFEWDVSIAREKFGLVPVYSFDSVIGPLSWTTAMVEKKTIQQEPELVQAFCNALAEAQAAIRTDRELFAKTSIAEFPQVSEATVRSASQNMLSTSAIPKSPLISKEEWDADMAMELEAGSIKAALPYETMVDNSFAQRAVARLAKAG